MRTLPNDRWACQQCGTCCHGFQLGPVEPHIIEDLHKRDVGRLWPRAADGWLTERGGRPFLRHRDGACVFLQPDRRCFLHATFGEEAKPGFCRIFPLRISDGPAGLTATIRPECARYHRAHRTGPPTAQALSALDGLSVPVTRIQDIALLPGVPLPDSDWPALEARLLQTTETAATPEATIAAMRPLLGLPAAGDPARHAQAAAALAYAIGAALQQTDGTDHLRSALATAQQRAAVPALSDDAQDYCGVVIRSHIASGDFQAYGSLAAGLGRVLLETRLARLSAELDGDTPLSADAFGESLARWLRLTANPSLRPLLNAAAPALIDLVRFAPAGTPQG